MILPPTKNLNQNVLKHEGASLSRFKKCFSSPREVERHLACMYKQRTELPPSSCLTDEGHVCQRTYSSQCSLVQWNWFLTSLDAWNSGAFSDIREPISLHQAVWQQHVRESAALEHIGEERGSPAHYFVHQKKKKKKKKRKKVRCKKSLA